MAFVAGRTVTVYQGDVATGTPLAAVRTKNLTINNEPIDVTTDDASGARTLLADPATKSIDFSAEGLIFDDVLLAKAVGGAAGLETYTLDITGIGTVAGDFFLNSMEVGAEYQDAVTFSASFQSSGAMTYTAAA